MRKIKKVIIPISFLCLFCFAAVTVQPASAYVGDTHSNMVDDAIDLLIAAGLDITEIDSYRTTIKMGSVQADNYAQYKHFMDPITHQGLEGIYQSAGDYADEKLNEAMVSYQNDPSPNNGFYLLGFALHLVQDLCVPGHSQIGGAGLPYHTFYETYCCDNYETLSDSVVIGEPNDIIYTFSSYQLLGLIHQNASTAFGWVDCAAHASYNFHSLCLLWQFETVASDLIPFTINLSAGFILFAYHQMNPDADVDGDGATYAEEIIAGTLPWDADCDDDTMPDGYEILHNFDPYSASDASQDTDADGLSNKKEYQIGTQPRIKDTDGDSMKDGWEYTYGLNPLSSSDKYLDKDGDGLNNYIEYSRGTNPDDEDTDGDDLNDYEEIYTYGTNPKKFDTDGDGYGDGWEIANGYDPLSYASRPISSGDPIFVP